jgi:hypothetical protein
MSVGDRMGLGPTRTKTENEDGSWTITVKPPAWLPGVFPAKSVVLDTEEKRLGFLAWQNGQLIQNALPMLSSEERGILIDGGIEL